MNRSTWQGSFALSLVSQLGTSDPPIERKTAEGNSAREFQGIRRRPERACELAELRGKNLRAMTTRPPFHRFEIFFQRLEQDFARPSDAAADDDRFRIENIDERTNRR